MRAITGKHVAGDNLDKDMESVTSKIAEIKLRHPNAVGPVKRPDGRILDLVSGEH